jgi:hypothetical protein
MMLALAFEFIPDVVTIISYWWCLMREGNRLGNRIGL